MAVSVEQSGKQPEADRWQCEYVPFGAEEKIKLSFELILKWLAVRTAKGAVPNEQDVMKFLMTCKARKLNPFDGDAFLIGYDGKDGPVFSTIVAHQAFLKRAETHPEFDGMESGVIIQTGDQVVELVGDFFLPSSRLLGGWATVFFVNRRHPMTKRLRLSTFDKGRSLWKSNPEGMIVKCAEADALRSSFPQLCGGMFLREEGDSGHRQTASPSMPALQDRRSEEIPAPFCKEDGERVFADRAGVPVNGGRTPRYTQDAAAADAQERIRGKATVTRPEPVVTEEGEAAMKEAIDDAQDDVFSTMLDLCHAAKGHDDVRSLRERVTRCLGIKSIADHHAMSLIDVLLEKEESFIGEISS